MPASSEEIRKLEEKKAGLHADIEKYGIELEAIQKNLDEASKIKTDTETLTKELEILRTEKVDIIGAQKEASALEETKAGLVTDIQKMTGLLEGMAEKKKVSDELDGKITAAHAELEILGKKKITAITDCATAEATFIEKKKDIEALESDTERRRLFRDYAHTDAVKAFGDIQAGWEESIATKKKEHADITQSILEKNRDLDVAKILLGILDENIKSLEGQYDQKKAAKDLELTKLGISHDAKQAELEQREGNVSLQEAALERKRSNLSVIKSRLEKERGKSINIEI